jgi:LDH2 family malate/lactate/ureidoglycolate dehydrogenase
MKLAIAKACKSEVGFVAVCNSNHFGIAGYYSMMALEHGCIGLSMTNTNRWMVPTYGRDPMLGTNPISVAAPAGSDWPFVLDMATSVVTVGKLEVFKRLGKPIPEGWAVDTIGKISCNPGAVLESVRDLGLAGLLPLGGSGEELGGHKGYGLAMCVDIFSALLSGAWYADQVYGLEVGGTRRRANLGHFFGAWRVEAFRPLDDFKAAMDDLHRRLKGSRKAEGQTRIWVPGEKEYEESERRLRDGIPLSAAVINDLQQLGAELGVNF